MNKKPLELTLILLLLLAFSTPSASTINQAYTTNQYGVVGGDVKQGEKMYFNVNITPVGGINFVNLTIWTSSPWTSGVVFSSFMTPADGWYTLEVQTNNNFPHAGSSGTCVGKGYGYGCPSGCSIQMA